MHRENVKIVIIGGVAAGATAAAKARRENESAEITLLEKGHFISYANCGIPFYVGGIINNRKDLLHYSPESFADRFNTDVYINCEVISIERDTKIVNASYCGRNIKFPYDKLIIAIGANPVIPPIEGIKDVNYFFMRTVPDAEKVINFLKEKKPSSAIIIGGGYIGVETAEAMYHCGIKTTIVEALDMILPNYPYIFSKFIKDEMEKTGILVKTGTLVKKVTTKGDKISITLSTGELLDSEMLFVCAGIAPNVELAKNCGISIDDLGAIKVDDHMKTSDQNIYAAGDAVSKVNLITGRKVLLPLAGPANREGRIAGANAAGGNMRFPGVLGTSIVGFNTMVVAGTGLTYKQAIKEGFDADFTYTINPQHVSYYPGAENIFLQVVFDKKNEKILGAFAAGKVDVARKIDTLATAIYGNIKVSDLGFIDYCYAPPFGNAKDNINIAGYVAYDMVNSKCGSISPEEFLKVCKQNKNIQVLDVRNLDERKEERFEDSIHILLNELRGMTQLLDKKKPVYAYCAVGYRGYLATKILQQNGFDVYNIRGGLQAIKVCMQE
jgi:NADPH-dependent 2,4-dienoyl-CoA reductase/sulfur reductase-like enzyme/rhodanese-related sulfurtransferase